MIPTDLATALDIGLRLAQIVIVPIITYAVLTLANIRRELQLLRVAISSVETWCSMHEKRDDDRYEWLLDGMRTLRAECDARPPRAPQPGHTQ